jgi:hypothetical protein
MHALVFTADTPSICRYIALRFERGPDTPGALLHGFAGYFDAELYKDVHLSIYPPTHTPNMFSWFPVYFPLRTPVHVPSVRGIAGRAGQAALRHAPSCVQGVAVEAQLWRCGNHAKVWYEWCTTAPQVRCAAHAFATPGADTVCACSTRSRRCTTLTGAATLSGCERG